ncbi:LysR family transcriptional regulator [Motilimonas eburnea]|uniref:LysR family transcriptional regulator n=1 Tax=Motilimonas eburnea TaxID=1737488 RepID=UPI001E594224|nr:LysR family transcriptional regulator [Motilimonas eburnea]MCE2573348.1 LysR family transcriptional regulator [Motilimonas eburnea]
MHQLDLAKYLPAFLKAASTLSFSKAARELDVTPAAISKAVKNLEEKLGVRLFHRTTHALSLTEDGESFYRAACPTAFQLYQLFESTRNLKTAPQGKLKVSVPEGYGKKYILPLVQPFLQLYPEIELDLHLDDRAVDLVSEGYDVAIGNRIGNDVNIVARKLTDMQITCVASPEFLAQYGQPKSVADLAQLPCIRYRSATSQRLFPWRFINQQGDTEFFEPRKTAVIVNNVEALCELASHGVGITLVATWQAEAYIKQGRLVALLPECTVKLPPAQIYYASRANQPAKVRVFIDYIVEHFSQVELN